MCDVRAFEETYNADVQSVLRYAQRRLPSDDAAWDVVAETFAIAWRRSQSALAGGQAALPWLYGIENNVVKNAQRSERRWRRLLGRSAAEPPEPAVDRVEAVDARLAAQRHLGRVLGQLPEKEREVLRLVAWEDLDLRGVALVLGITPGAAKARLFRAAGVRSAWSTRLLRPTPRTFNRCSPAARGFAQSQ